MDTPIHGNGLEASPRPQHERLDSWKAIAGYLHRDVTTVQRWEKREAMPVHRHQHLRRGSVYAFRSEIDAWWRSRAETLTVETDDATMSGGDPDASAPPFRPASRGWMRVSLILVLTVTVGYLLWGRAGALRGPFDSVAVLPLENLSGDPSQDHFADGMTEALIASLARVNGLKVVSRPSVMRFKATRKPLPAVAEELGVEAVVVGSVQRDADRVAVRVQLVHGRTDSNIWVGEYERHLIDVIALQGEVGRAVAREVRGQLVPPLDTSRPAARVDPAAYQDYLLGRFHVWKFSEEHLVRAIHHFERAIARDPAYAPAYAGLAHAWWIRGVFGTADLKDVELPARRAARRALQLDATLSEAHAVHGYLQAIFDWDWPRAEHTIRHALQLDWNNVDAHYTYALLMMALERSEEALSHIAMAAERDPFSAQIHSTYGRVLYRARRFDEAVVRLDHAIALDPGNVAARVRLGDTYAQMGRFADALAAYEGARMQRADLDDRLAWIYATMGERTRAERLLAGLRAAGDTPLGAAAAYAALGQTDDAFRVLFDGLDERRQLAIFVKAEPKFEQLHGDRRWAVLLQRLKLPS